MAEMGFTPNLVAGGNIFPFRMVELSTSAEFTGLQSNAASDTVVGVTDGSIRLALDADGHHAKTGDPITLQPSNTVQVQAGGNITIGALLTSDSAGKAVVGTSGQVCYYIALQAAADGDIIRVFRYGGRAV